MINVLIHGATNWGSSNFGDVIYADQVARFVLDRLNVASVQMAEPSDFVAKVAPYATSNGLTVSNSDALVYIPGGYFGEGHAAGLLDNSIHFLRFFPVGLRAAMRKTPIAIIGVGAGPIRSSLLKTPIRIICSHAETIVVRDTESRLALERLGVSNVIESFDPILSINLESCRKQNEQFRKLRRGNPDKKTLFVHFNHSELATHVFGDAAASFLKTHPDYMIVTSFDQQFKNPEERMARFFDYVPDAIAIDYSNPYELIDVLKECNLVLTCKLHVGVVAAMYQKSVICAAEHPEKSQRFYDAIGEHERCVSLYESGASKVKELLDRYEGAPTVIPGELYKKASLSWEMLGSFLDSIG